MINRAPERVKFLDDLLTTAIENGGYGFFSVDEWPTDLPPSQSYAVIRGLESGEVFHVNLDTMAHGLTVIWSARLDREHDWLVNATTGERLYFGGDARDQLLLAERTNGGEGGYDVIVALAVLECALFGHVVYA